MATLLDQTPATAPISGADLLYLVTDPGGSPTDTKVTWQQLIDSLPNKKIGPLLINPANTAVAILDGTNAASFNVYNFMENSYADFERFSVRWDSNDVCLLQTEASGTGTLRDMKFNAGNRAAKIADPSGGSTTDAEARTAIEAIIDVLETWGLAADS